MSTALISALFLLALSRGFEDASVVSRLPREIFDIIIELVSHRWIPLTAGIQR